MSNDWLDDALIRGPLYCLCKSKKEFKRKLKETGLPKSLWPKFISDGADATTHILETDSSRTMCIVCIGGVNPDRVDQLLVHEAVHVWQEALDVLKETEPSCEFQAYAIQRIYQELADAYYGGGE